MVEMNNKITLYELLGKIKDGQAPKRIKYINSIWEYDKETKDYFNDDLWLIYSMNSIGLTEREVEILDNEDEDIEELPIWCSSYPKGEDITTEQDHMITNSKKINELVRAVNKLKKEGK